MPTYEKVNEELFLDNPLHVILNNSKLAYRIHVILIANKELIKKSIVDAVECDNFKSRACVAGCSHSYRTRSCLIYYSFIYNFTGTDCK
jgi:hypothetical protein